MSIMIEVRVRRLYDELSMGGMVFHGRSNMLVLSRKDGEAIIVGDGIHHQFLRKVNG